MNHTPKFARRCAIFVGLAIAFSFGSVRAQDVPSGSDGYGHRILNGTPQQNNGVSNAGLMVNDGIARTLLGPPITEVGDGATPRRLFYVTAISAIFDQINLTLQSLINTVRIRDGLPPIDFPNSEFDEPTDPADPVDEETPAEEVLTAKAAVRAGRIGRQSFAEAMSSRLQSEASSR